MSDWLSSEELARRDLPASSRIHRSARLEVDALALGEHCTLEAGVWLRGGEMGLGDWCYLGPGVRIRAPRAELVYNCVFFADTWLAALTDLIIGPWAKISPGCRLMAGEIRIGCEFWMNRGAEVGGGGWRNPDAGFQAGDRCHVGRNSHLNVADSITVGDDTAVGMNCVLATHAHWQPVTEGYFRKVGPIHLGAGVALYSQAVIGPGIEIGDGATVAAGAVVTRDVPPRAFAAGVPARVLLFQKPPADRDGAIRDLLREVLRQHWGDGALTEGPGHLHLPQPEEGVEILYRQHLPREPQPKIPSRDGWRTVLFTDSPLPGSLERCVFNLAERTLDGFSTPLTEALRNALFPYGLRFRYLNYARDRLDPAALEAAGLA